MNWTYNQIFFCYLKTPPPHSLNDIFEGFVFETKEAIGAVNFVFVNSNVESMTMEKFILPKWLDSQIVTHSTLLAIFIIPFWMVAMG